MLKWYKEFKLLQINSFEKEWDKKLDQLEKNLLNLVKVNNEKRTQRR